MLYDDKTLSEVFAGCFQHTYDGSQQDRVSYHEFNLLTDNRISWTQVHGDVKDLAKRALFVPYPHWRELHECCGLAIRSAISLDKTQLHSGIDCARIMGAAMAILKKKYGHDAPKWWLPLMRQVRGA